MKPEDSEDGQKQQKKFTRLLKTIIGLCFLIAFLLLLFLPQINRFFSRPAKQEKQRLAEELKPFLEAIHNKLPLPTITPAIYLKKGEEAYLQEYVTFSEPKSHTLRIRAGFRPVKGVYVGGILPKFITAITRVDEGNLILTNKRVIFNGTNTTQSIDLNKIISVDIFQEGISIAKEKRKKEYFFSTKKPWLWKILLHYLKTGNLLPEIKIEELGVDTNR